MSRKLMIKDFEQKYVIDKEMLGNLLRSGFASVSDFIDGFGLTKAHGECPMSVQDIRIGLETGKYPLYAQFQLASLGMATDYMLPFLKERTSVFKDDFEYMVSPFTTKKRLGAMAQRIYSISSPYNTYVSVLNVYGIHEGFAYYTVDILSAKAEQFRPKLVMSTNSPRLMDRTKVTKGDFGLSIDIGIENIWFSGYDEGICIQDDGFDPKIDTITNHDRFPHWEYNYMAKFVNRQDSMSKPFAVLLDGF